MATALPMAAQGKRSTRASGYFSEAQADKGDLGEGIDGVRNDIVVHYGFVTHGIIRSNFTLHRGDMGQPGSVYEITDGVDTRKVGLHLFIDAHTSAFVIQTLLHQLLEAA